MKNILFITVDQWRGDCLSINGHPLLKTPFLDKLAEKSTRFLRHYSQTVPCGPARASIYTGMYQQNHRVTHNGAPLDSRHTNIAFECRKKGYEPTLIGYTDTAHDPRTLPSQDPRFYSYEHVLPGFECYTRMQHANPVNWLVWLKNKGYDINLKQDQWEIHRPILKKEQSHSNTLTPAVPLYKNEHSEAAFLVEQACNYITAQRNEKWFLHLSLSSPHYPFIVPEPYNTLYEPSEMPLPLRQKSLEQELKQHPFLEAARNIVMESQDKFAFGHSRLNAESSTETIQQLKATYYGMISEVDEKLGHLFQFLEDEDLMSDTMIIFTSDHGEQLGDHYLLNKCGYFEQSYHVPLIIKHPQQNEIGTSVEAFTEHVDLMPTILDAIKIEPPLQCDGESLGDFLEGKKPSHWRQEVHWEYDFRKIQDTSVEKILGLKLDECSLNVIRDEKFKYVHFNKLEPLLFDLHQDPEEFYNLAQLPEYKETLYKYARKLIDWRMRNDERLLSGTIINSNGIFERQHKERFEQ